MTRTRIRILAVGGPLAATVLLLATAAAAATLTVSAGTTPAGAVLAVTGTSQGAVQFTDTTTNQGFYCSSSSFEGTVKVGASSGAAVGTVTGPSVVFSNCTGPFGLVFNITGYGTWNINAVSYNASTGVSTGTITNIVAHFETPPGASPACSWDVGRSTSTTGFASTGTTLAQRTASTPGGLLRQTYSNTTQLLKTTVTNPGTLGLWNVRPFTTPHNCWSNSVYKQGDLATFDGSYKLVATATSQYPNPNPIKVVSP